MLSQDRGGGRLDRQRAGLSEFPIGSERMCTGSSAYLPQFIERRTACLLGAERTFPLRNAPSLPFPDARDGDNRVG
jgi:hypothetical protein